MLILPHDDCISCLVFVLFVLNAGPTPHVKNHNALKWVDCCWKLSLTNDVTANRKTVAGGRRFATVSLPAGAAASLGVYAGVTSRRMFPLRFSSDLWAYVAGANWSINVSETRRTVRTLVQQVWPFNARLAPRAVLFYIMRRRLWPLAAAPRNDQSGLKGILPKMPFHALFKETSEGRIGKHAAVWAPACDQFHGQPECFGHKLKC